jgi:RNA-directed DNA polymerase
LRCKQKIRELTRRTRGISLEQMLKELTAYLRGWTGYFSFCQTPSVLQALDQWMRHRLRSMIWKQWKRGKQRYGQLRQRGVGQELAAQTAGSPHGPWRVANSPALSIALPLAYFDSLGLPRLFEGPARNPLNRPMRTRMSGGVAGASGQPLPLCRLCRIFFEVV